MAWKHIANPCEMGVERTDGRQVSIIHMGGEDYDAEFDVCVYDADYNQLDKLGDDVDMEEAWSLTRAYTKANP
jgi:hypothetical protein